MNPPQILMVAGEASGDFYAAELAHRLSELNPEIQFFGMGGDRMESTGVELTHHIRDLSVMGFIEVATKLPALYRSFREILEEAHRRQPEAVVLVDFPDYNLRLAQKLRQVCDAKIVYYIGPTVWAWRRGRVKTVKRAIDKMLVIFPFEEPIYRTAGVDVSYVGHPLVGTVKPRRAADIFFKTFKLDPERPIIGLFPGSRKKEIAAIRPILQAAARELAMAGPYQFALGLADTVEPQDVQSLLGTDPPVRVVRNGTHDLMKRSAVVLVGCGTAPLEAAMLDTPQVVVYKTTPVTYRIASRLVSVPHVCMVNLILERRAVPELIQHDFTVERVVAEATRLLTDDAARISQLEAFRELRGRLGESGAAQRAAMAVLAAAQIPAHEPPCVMS